MLVFTGTHLRKLSVGASINQTLMEGGRLSFESVVYWLLYPSLKALAAAPCVIGNLFSGQGRCALDGQSLVRARTTNETWTLVCRPVMRSGSKICASGMWSG